ncbi:ThuA domain-containing protein [Arthrobacter sp. GMC3]|uniref:ThuA domain-containing protein n=1 Tax=Arthrobacter sp. GMC3 TaxID=2058894 RepID=UPI0015E3A174|nr:ThuA domain-containing protein [Arthrobacter sp. GMC3]
MTAALILSDVDSFRDEWHDLPSTTEQIRTILVSLGITTRITDAPPQLPTDTNEFALVVINLGTIRADADPIVNRLTTYVEAGGAILAVHSSAVGLGHSEIWRSIIGGSWVEDFTWHPDEGEGEVSFRGIGAPNESRFRLHDEFYTDLVTVGRPREVAWHERGGVRHPLVWVKESGSGRVAYSALGHSAQSFKNAGHRKMLTDLARWLLPESSLPQGNKR